MSRRLPYGPSLSPASTLPNLGRASAVHALSDFSIIAVQQLAFWTADQVRFLVDNVGPDFSAKDYRAAAVEHKM